VNAQVEVEALRRQRQILDGDLHDYEEVSAEEGMYLNLHFAQSSSQEEECVGKMMPASGIDRGRACG
jgi:hypothetical protein